MNYRTHPSIESRKSWHRSTLLLLSVLLATSLTVRPAGAITGLYSEGFEDIAKFTSPTYGIPNAWSPNPPPGWDISTSVPLGGIPEWEGWTFWRKNLWQAIGEGPRVAFDRGEGTIAIADNDLWNDDNQPARRGFYNTFLQTEAISLDRRLKSEERLVLAFDTSWFARECCDDSQSNPGNQLRNNQTGIVRARLPDNSVIDVLRWESAPFRDGQGRPTDQPFDPSGNANTQNPFFFPLEANERIYIDLSFIPPPPNLALLTEGEGPALSSSGEGEISFEFAMEDAGDDGYWAVDNIQLASFEGAMAGDMFIDGVLDQKDIDEFALGLLDEAEYTAKWFGETPGARGSDDASFDYDDIPWFLGIMEGASSVEEPAMALAQALYGIPEPSTALIFGIGLVGWASTCGRAAKGSL